MITSKDVRYELDEAKKVIESNATVDDKIKSLYKLLTVCIKIALSIRSNSKQIMTATGAEKIEPRKKGETVTEVEE